VDEITEEDLEEVLRGACREAADRESANIVSVAGAIRRRAGSPEDPLRALVAALEYHLVVEPEQRRRYGPFGPMMEGEGKVYPAPLDRIDPEVFPLWARAFDRAPISLVAARFADLLWEGRFGDRPYEWAQRAVDAYLAAIEEEFGHPIEKSDGARRALEVATQINDQSRPDAAVKALLSLVRRSLDGEEHLPGVSLPIIDLLVRREKRDRPAELDQLLERAIERYGEDPWLLESALEIKARLVEPGDRKSLYRGQAEAFADRARRSEGIAKYAHFQHAIELAQQHGLRELADDLRREVESLPEDALGMKTISAHVEIPREEIEQFINRIVGDDDLSLALRRFGAHVPTGHPEENREVVRRLMADHPLQFLVTRMVIGPDNVLLRAVRDEEDHEELALIDHEVQGLSFFGVFGVDILAKMRERYGPVSAAAHWFESPLIEPFVAERIGRAIALFEEGDYDASASILAPRLERVIRSVARAVGLSVTKSPDARGRPGGVKGLGELLAGLEGSLPEATRRYLRALLSEVTGPNLRNRIGHGLTDLVTPQEAALLIQAACHVRLLKVDDGSGNESAQ
jgi:hypothetical protein